MQLWDQLSTGHRVAAIAGIFIVGVAFLYALWPMGEVLLQGAGPRADTTVHCGPALLRASRGCGELAAARRPFALGLALVGGCVLVGAWLTRSRGVAPTTPSAM